jgi:hypothetical protein
MSTSADGKFVLVSQGAGATSQLTLFSVNGTALTMLDTQMVTGTVTSVAVTSAP